MCGIVGVIGESQQACSVLLEGLKRLEYRGYDSAGVALIDDRGGIKRRRAEGKLANLEHDLQDSPLTGTVGIGHTRWATHGIPNEANAHPHATDRVAVVHNGIIENYDILRKELQDSGYNFASQTDTEVIPVLITCYLDRGDSPLDAVRNTISRLEGAYALGIIFAGHPDMLYAVRHGAPLAVGHGDTAMYLGSDAIALAPFTSRLTYLEEGEWAQITKNGLTIYGSNGEEVSRPPVTSNLSGAAVEKGNYRHFMQKEIFEQSLVLAESLSIYFNPAEEAIHLPELSFSLRDISCINLIGCGTSYYAAQTAQYWLEKYAKIPVTVDIASEFRYRGRVMAKDSLAVFISQSGETADTLAALRLAKKQGVKTLAIVNVGESTMAKEADSVLLLYAGPEIGVASTKAFTAQLCVLACFTLALSRVRDSISATTHRELLHALMETPSRVAEILRQDEKIATLAHDYTHTGCFLYIGRGTVFPIAMEGALKLKELSYVHAEGYAAGELKHGPIALIDESVSIVVLAPADELLDKTLSNAQEAAARGGNILLISDKPGMDKGKDLMKHGILMPGGSSFTAPILYSIPVQLLAYHIAVYKGTDVDQPRNLAKSVTVE